LQWSNVALCGESIDWFSKNEHPDLIFLDIQLSDGLSFEIFEKVSIKSCDLYNCHMMNMRFVLLN
jgi:two-component SAPR family response regulator